MIINNSNLLPVMKEVLINNPHHQMDLKKMKVRNDVVGNQFYIKYIFSSCHDTIYWWIYDPYI